MFELIELLYPRPKVDPLALPDCARLVSTKEQQQMSPDGSHVVGGTHMEYVATDGSLKEVLKPFFVCLRDGQKHYGASNPDHMCPDCRRKMYATKAVVSFLAIGTAGVILIATWKILLAGAVVWAIAKYNSMNKEPAAR